MGKLVELKTTDLLQALSALLSEGQFLPEELGNLYLFQRNDGVFDVRSTKRASNIATFSLAPLPGCCGIAVSYYSEVHAYWREKGLGRFLLAVRMGACRRAGYGYMLASVLADNPVEIGLLAAAGWIKIGEFRNPKTNNIVLVFGVNL